MRKSIAPLLAATCLIASAADAATSRDPADPHRRADRGPDQGPLRLVCRAEHCAPHCPRTLEGQGDPRHHPRPLRPAHRTDRRRRGRGRLLPPGVADRRQPRGRREVRSPHVEREHQAVAVAPDLRASEGYPDTHRCADQALPDAHARCVRARWHRPRRGRPREGAGARRRDLEARHRVRSRTSPRARRRSPRLRPSWKASRPTSSPRTRRGRTARLRCGPTAPITCR